jgi:calcineurin-like phosphoesterase family protein
METGKIVEIAVALQITYNKRKFYLSHYPTITADLNSNPETCVINIYGHIHSKEKFYEERPYMYCVALDAQDNKPVSIEQVYREIQEEIESCERFLV